MLAIYDRPGSFSDRWKTRCDELGIPYLCVDLFSDDLIPTLRKAEITGLLCHPPMYHRASTLAAATIIKVCSAAGINVFPRDDDYWHFDDKIAQKYLFQALDIPTPETHVFFDPLSATEWMRQSPMPLVTKLKAGAGSINVSLIRTPAEGIRHVDRMFGRGIPATDGAVKDVYTKIRRHRANRDWVATLKRLPNTLRNMKNLRRDIERERGYCYCQEFVKGNDHDTRVTVIGDRAFAFRRGVRPGDFRASGSNLIEYDPQQIDIACVELAFKAARCLRTTCIAFDFVMDGNSGSPLIVEMSFAFKAEAVHGCHGHWDSELHWHEGHRWPQDAILDDFLAGIPK